MALDREWVDGLVDDSGSGADGTVVHKADFVQVYDDVDAELARLDSDVADAVAGTVGITSNGTKVTAVAFPATQAPSADANTLDDYEEGSWTPVIGGSTSESGQTYTTQVGRYTKIGRRVFGQCYVALSAVGTVTGTVLIKGLPFPTRNTANQWAAASVGFWANIGSVYVVTAHIAPNTSAIILNVVVAAAGSVTAMAAGALTNTSAFIVNFDYETDN
jgi:hypothetical protein